MDILRYKYKKDLLKDIIDCCSLSNEDEASGPILNLVTHVLTATDVKPLLNFENTLNKYFNAEVISRDFIGKVFCFHLPFSY